MTGWDGHDPWELPAEPGHDPYGEPYEPAGHPADLPADLPPESPDPAPPEPADHPAGLPAEPAGLPAEPADHPAALPAEPGDHPAAVVAGPDDHAAGPPDGPADLPPEPPADWTADHAHLPAEADGTEPWGADTDPAAWSDGGGDPFPPALDLDVTPADGGPWTDPDLLGGTAPDDWADPPADPPAALLPDLAAADGDPTAGWPALHDSDDPAVRALAAHWHR